MSEGRVCAGGMQIGRLMAGSKADGRHACPAGCLDAEDRIFDNRATLWVGTKALGGQQKEIGCGFAGGDLDGAAEDVEMAVEADAGERAAGVSPPANNSTKQFLIHTK